MSDFPIIGICGPSKSGKDTVADWFTMQKHFGKVAFADPIKRFAQKVFNCSFETLWGPSDLRDAHVTYSEEEWFAIIGRAMKAIPPFLSDLVPSNLQLQSFITISEWMHSMRESHKTNGYLTMREVLQTLGTEWGRRRVDQLIWVNYLYKKIVPRLSENKQGTNLYDQSKGIFSLKDAPEYGGIIIPDHRFLNEIKATQANGGYCIKLRRLAIQEDLAKANVGIQGHQSEVEIQDIPDSVFDLVLELLEGVENVYARLEQIYKDRAWEIKRKVTSNIETTTMG